MAASTVGTEKTSEVFSWLKSLPLAPEYRPTLIEFQDPISYIFKIEKEASKYGICKIIPPVPPNPKKTTISNLNRSLAARAGNTYDTKSAPPTFTTRQQQIGFCPRKPRPVQRPVWQSGEYYTFQQFEAKAKSFEKSYLKKIAAKKVPSPLEIETLYWKATVDKPFSIEYANDMPGSAFAPVNTKKCREAGDSVTLGETAWNMRCVSRAKGSLLRFMKQDIPGVTSPMVYVAMMFSWFAWHVEDHDLHSLNYMHMGGGKTWYGVPREAAVAFEEVVRVHGYGGEVNPLVTFSTLSEKTTVMSPEVFINAGIPCCRLVQNAGEFVVTFPRAYHSGFSHGFNCGEAANIATPEWLRFAKDAAIRRASINYPPMVSHFQLLYDLALSLSSRLPPTSGSAEPRSSRLKHKKKSEGESIVKELFVQNVIQNNDLLHTLSEGSSVVIIPHNSSDISTCSNLRVGGSQLKAKPKLYLGLSNQEEEAINESIGLDTEVKHFKGYYPVKEKIASLCEKKKLPSLKGNGDANTLNSQTLNIDSEKDSLSDQILFSCTTCGILNFSCMAIVQPRETTVRYLMSNSCSSFNDNPVGPGLSNEDVSHVDSMDGNASNPNANAGRMAKSVPDGLYDVPIQSCEYEIQGARQDNEVDYDTEANVGPTSLNLLALNYANSSDSEDDQAEPNISDSNTKIIEKNFSSFNQDFDDRSSSDDEEDRMDSIDTSNFTKRNYETYDCSVQFETDDIGSLEERGSAERTFTDLLTNSNFSKTISPFPNTTLADSSRMHVFCPEHAVEVEQRLRSVGGVDILLLCHQDYPKVEAEAKLVAEELGLHHSWKDVSFRDATNEDKERIQSALASEEAVPGNGDWAVKLGINLYYSAILSRSPLYIKQMPYNSVIYKAFGCDSLPKSPSKPKVFYGKRPSRKKKILVAGKWCGKVWMSNQVHPLLVPKEPSNEHDHEKERSFRDCSNPSEENLKREIETPCKSESFKTLKKYEKKRKIGINSCRSSKKTKIEDEEERESGNSSEDHPPRKEFRSVKKVKSREFEYSFSDTNDSCPEEDIPIPLGRNRTVLKSKQQMKEETPEKNFKKFDSDLEDELEGGPSTRLRKRKTKPQKDPEIIKKQITGKNTKKAPTSINRGKIKEEEEAAAVYQCDMDGCEMTLASKHELVLHKRNICPVRGCGKKFFSHKYLVQHRRVHMDDRPLKCPWKGCKMTFKWAWARTEHIRVHTGARPYVCGVSGCGQTFRFVSDFSRHKRKTGHSTKKARKN